MVYMLLGSNASMKGFIMLFKCMKELDMKTTSAIMKKEVWLLVTMPGLTLEEFTHKKHNYLLK